MWAALISVVSFVYCLQCSGIGNKQSLPLYQNQHTNTCCFHLMVWRWMQHFPRNTSKFLPKCTASSFRKNKLFSVVIVWTRLKVSYTWSSTLHFLNSSASGYCGSQGKSTDTDIPFIGKYLIFKSINVRRYGGRI